MVGSKKKKKKAKTEVEVEKISETYLAFNIEWSQLTPLDVNRHGSVSDFWTERAQWISMWWVTFVFGATSTQARFQASL